MKSKWNKSKDLRKIYFTIIGFIVYIGLICIYVPSLLSAANDLLLIFGIIIIICGAWGGYKIIEHIIDLITDYDRLNEFMQKEKKESYEIN